MEKVFIGIYFFIAGECLKLQSYFLVLILQMKQNWLGNKIIEIWLQKFFQCDNWIAGRSGKKCDDCPPSLHPGVKLLLLIDKK